MSLNALITSIKPPGKETGRSSEPGDNVLAAGPTPLTVPCTMIDPSDYQVATAKSRGVELERMVMVSMAALRGAGVVVGDGGGGGGGGIEEETELVIERPPGNTAGAETLRVVRVRTKHAPGAAHVPGAAGGAGDEIRLELSR